MLQNMLRPLTLRPHLRRFNSCEGSTPPETRLAALRARMSCLSSDQWCSVGFPGCAWLSLLCPSCTQDFKIVPTLTLMTTRLCQLTMPPLSWTWVLCLTGEHLKVASSCEVWRVLFVCCCLICFKAWLCLNIVLLLQRCAFYPTSSNKCSFRQLQDLTRSTWPWSNPDRHVCCSSF